MVAIQHVWTDLVRRRRCDRRTAGTASTMLPEFRQLLGDVADKPPNSDFRACRERHRPRCPVSALVERRGPLPFQRTKVHDLYDLHRFATEPFDGELLRALVVLKLWQVRDPFVPDARFEKLRSGKYDWADLQRLLRTADRVESKARRPRSSFEQLREATLPKSRDEQGAAGRNRIQ